MLSEVLQFTISQGKGIHEAKNFVELYIYDPIYERDAQSILKSLFKTGHSSEIDYAAEWARSLSLWKYDVTKRLFSLRLFKLLVEKDRNIHEAIEVAKKGAVAKNIDWKVNLDSLELFEALVAKGAGINEAREAADAAKSRGYLFRESAERILKAIHEREKQ